MRIHIVSIFPEIFKWFIDTSIIHKAVCNKKIELNFYNPRYFCYDKHKQIDDEIYWWWSWMLLKAKPVIDCTMDIINSIKTQNFKIIYFSPSKNIFDQENAIRFKNFEDLILVCWRYEWIDYRFEKYFMDNYPQKFEKLSLWKFILMWGEVASMAFIEATTRLKEWVLWQQDSLQEESYTPHKQMQNIEYPQYTRPQNVYWYNVPDELLSWNHSMIKKRREDNERSI